MPKSDCANERSEYPKVNFKAKDASAWSTTTFFDKKQVMKEAPTFKIRSKSSTLIDPASKSHYQEQIAYLRVDCQHRLPRWTSQMQIDEPSRGQMQIDEPSQMQIDEPSQMQINDRARCRFNLTCQMQ